MYDGIFILNVKHSSALYLRPQNEKSVLHHGCLHPNERNRFRNAKSTRWSSVIVRKYLYGVSARVPLFYNHSSREESREPLATSSRDFHNSCELREQYALSASFYFRIARFLRVGHSEEIEQFAFTSSVTELLKKFGKKRRLSFPVLTLLPLFRNSVLLFLR